MLPDDVLVWMFLIDGCLMAGITSTPGMLSKDKGLLLVGHEKKGCRLSIFSTNPPFPTPYNNTGQGSKVTARFSDSGRDP